MKLLDFTWSNSSAFDYCYSKDEVLNSLRAHTDYNTEGCLGTQMPPTTATHPYLL